jgi:geranylgeranyl diphosphate synthase type 3
MVLDKTGGLFRLSVNLMRAFSDDNRDFTKLTNLLALFFQIRDDYLNLHSDDYMKLKDLFEDLTEGKFSFPIIHCIRTRPRDHRLLSILRKRTHDVNVKKHAVEWIRDCGSFKFTVNRLREVGDEIEKELKALGGNKALSMILAKLRHGVLDEQEEMQPTETTTSS